MRSIYANNSISGLGSYSVEPDMNYFGEAGSLAITLEGLQNDQAIFEAVIAGDFAEVNAAINEGAEVEIITEASLGDFVDKIKEYAKKAWTKIKGLVMSFITKIQSVFIRDNKDLVKKYKSKIGNNLTKYNDKFKYKWADRTNEAMIANSVDVAYVGLKALFSEINKIKNMKDIEDLSSDLSDGTGEDKMYGSILSGSDAKSFKKDYHEYLWNEKDTVEGLSDGRFGEICQTLESSKKELDALKKLATNIDKVFNNTIKEIDNAKKAMEKGKMYEDDSNPSKLNDTVKAKDEKKSTLHNTSMAYATTGTSKTKQLSYAKLNILQKLVSLEQKVLNNITSANITETKFGIAQARRVFVQAASWGKVNEEVDLLQMIGEASDFEVETSFEDYEF